MFRSLVSTDKSGSQIFLRLALGAVMFPHGAQKVLGWFGGCGLAKTLDVFSGMGFPSWSIFLLMGIELVGPLFLILGLLTRIWALGVGVSVTICMFINHAQHGFFMNWFGRQQGEGFEYHLLVIGIAIALFIRGGGLLSVDRALISGRERRRVYL
jgi:putative oxidoreductase